MNTFLWAPRALTEWTESARRAGGGMKKDVSLLWLFLNGTRVSNLCRYCENNKCDKTQTEGDGKPARKTLALDGYFLTTTLRIDDSARIKWLGEETCVWNLTVSYKRLQYQQIRKENWMEFNNVFINANNSWEYFKYCVALVRKLSMKNRGMHRKWELGGYRGPFGEATLLFWWYWGTLGTNKSLF